VKHLTAVYKTTGTQVNVKPKAIYSQKFSFFLPRVLNEEREKSACFMFSSLQYFDVV